MKRNLLLISFVLLCACLQAQQPFKEYGYKVKIATLSKGKYIEHFDQDTLVQIGSVIMNRLNGQIVSFVQYDTVYHESDLQPELISRWMSPDPLADEFYNESPYNFVRNNPIRYTDPTGMAPNDVIITGNKSQEALQELQKSVAGQLNLSMNDAGKVTATRVGDGELTKGASDLLNATTDNSIIVNVSATDNDFVSDNSAPLLGAFMGNKISDSDPQKIETSQEINPVALGKMDEINKKPGQSTLHEVTESYAGGRLSQAMGGTPGTAGKATPADAANPNSIYRQAHDNVVPQSGRITEHFYNATGAEVFRGTPSFAPVKLQYTTRGKVFHTVPKE